MTVTWSVSLKKREEAEKTENGNEESTAAGSSEKNGSGAAQDV